MDNVPDEVFHRLVRQVYVAGQDGSEWPDVLASLSNTMGFLALALHSHDTRSNSNITFLTHNYSPEFHASYRAYYAPRNPWNERAALARVGVAIPSPTLLPSEDLRRTEFYNDWIRPQGDIGTGAGITLYRDQQRFLRLSANVRFKDSDGLLPPLLTLLDRLGPHLRGAFDMGQLLSHARTGEAYRQAIELADSAVLVVDREGRLCLFNSKAAALLRSGEYLKADSSQRLGCIDEAAQLVLDGFVAALRDGRHPLPLDALLHNRSEPVVATMKVSMFATAQQDPRPSRFFPDREPVAIVAVSVPGRRSHLSSTEVQRQFGLTGAELMLALHLAQGHSLQSFAEKRRVSDNTVRSQVKSVLHKTGSRRQAELVAMMNRLLGPQN